MSTTIQDLPIKKGIVSIEQVWRTKIKIRYKDKNWVINTPQSFGMCSVGDVFRVQKVDYKTKNGIKKKLKGDKVQTTMPELLPLKDEKDVKLLNIGNGLVQIEIEGTKYIVLQRYFTGITDMKIGETQKFKSEKFSEDRVVIIRVYDFGDQNSLFD